jgi:hypothetical protein
MIHQNEDSYPSHHSVEKKSNRSLILAAMAEAADLAAEAAADLAADLAAAAKVAVQVVDLEDLVVAKDILLPCRGNPPAAEEEADT